MNLKKLEKEVIENSELASSLMTHSFIKKYENKYIVFHKYNHYIVESLKAGIEKGIYEFGEKAGFLVKKITKVNPVFSSLIKL